MSFDVTLMLCSAAESVNNLLYIHGGGWTMTPPDAGPSAIALHIKFTPDEMGAPHTMRLELMEADGDPYVFPTPVGLQPLRLETELDLPGFPPDTDPAHRDFDVPPDLALAVGIGPLTLRPASRYEWRLYIDDATQDAWTLPFWTSSDYESDEAA